MTKSPEPLDEADDQVRKKPTLVTFYYLAHWIVYALAAFVLSALLVWASFLEEVDGPWYFWIASSVVALILGTIFVALAVVTYRDV